MVAMGPCLASQYPYNGGKKANMSEDQGRLVTARYLRVSYTGEPVAQKVLGVLRRAVESAQESKSRGIILDLTDTDHALSWADRIKAGTAIAALQSEAAWPIPVAVIVPGPDLDPRKLGTNAATRRGGHLNAFTTAKAARAWLRTQ
jgi:hypothetical protein